MEKTVKKIVARPFHMASVEIIIPFHGEQAKVTSLIENIFQTVHTNKYLVTLVDDCSVNKNFVKDIEKAKIAGVRCLRQERHNGFGAAVNLALKTPFRVNPTYVCILQSDVTLHDAAWLSNLGHSLLSNNQIGMISPLTDNPVIESPILTAKRDEKRKDSILNEGYLPNVLCFGK
jgi:GT2 family glycosyltransferase